MKSWQRLKKCKADSLVFSSGIFLSKCWKFGKLILSECWLVTPPLSPAYPLWRNVGGWWSIPNKLMKNGYFLLHALNCIYQRKIRYLQKNLLIHIFHALTQLKYIYAAEYIRIETQRHSYLSNMSHQDFLKFRITCSIYTFNLFVSKRFFTSCILKLVYMLSGTLSDTILSFWVFRHGRINVS